MSMMKNITKYRFELLWKSIILVTLGILILLPVHVIHGSFNKSVLIEQERRLKSLRLALLNDQGKTTLR